MMMVVMMMMMMKTFRIREKMEEIGIVKQDK